ncbi:MAG: VanW family protein [Clostridia bacterium]|nr:VanW family protein [Clostridia bacterium]
MSSIIFLHDHSYSSFNQLNNLSVANYIKDDTIFNLRYDNKVWTFFAHDFELNSKVFSIDARINNYNRNGTRQDKIKLINKLIEIKITPEIAFNYIYLGFNNKLNKIQKNIEKLPKDAEIKISNNKINIENEIVGIKLDKYLFYNNLIKSYNGDNKIINLDIPVIKSIPNITRKSLEKYTYKRSEFATSIATSSTGRKFNIRKALNSINGTHLSKYEKFSFNNCVGKRTADKGYKNAKIILDGEFVEGVGGGVCQVSSTLYNAVLLAGLNVTSSQKHSQRVSYVQAGFDAMVNYGTSDLVFENNTEGDIYILCKYTDTKITISIYGANLGSTTFKLQNEVVNPVSAGEAEIIYDTEGKYIDKVLYNDEYFELKKARDGYTVKSYVIKLIDGVEIDKVLLRTDKYLPVSSVIVYGTKQRNLYIPPFVVE